MSTVVLMGPAGSGKTTVGQLLAERLQGEFVDADAHHSEESTKKMRRGEALTDADRLPWLLKLAEVLRAPRERSLVLACSALKAEYRNILGAGELPIQFFLLDVPEDILSERLRKRGEHFFSPELLRSQLEILERPRESEKLATVVDGLGAPEAVSARIAARLL